MNNTGQEVYEDRPNQGMSEPSSIYTNRINSIEIRQQDYGYLVRVGCKEFAIEKPEKLTRMLTEYILDPENMHKRWDEMGSKIFI